MTRAKHLAFASAVSTEPLPNEPSDDPHPQSDAPEPMAPFPHPVPPDPDPM